MRHHTVWVVMAFTTSLAACAAGEVDGGRRPAPGGAATSSVDGGPSGHGDPGAADGNVKAPTPQ